MKSKHGTARMNASILSTTEIRMLLTDVKRKKDSNGKFRKKERKLLYMDSNFPSEHLQVECDSKNAEKLYVSTLIRIFWSCSRLDLHGRNTRQQCTHLLVMSMNMRNRRKEWLCLVNMLAKCETYKSA